MLKTYTVMLSIPLSLGRFKQTRLKKAQPNDEKVACQTNFGSLTASVTGTLS